MACKNPFFSKKLGVLFSCGQCLPCRISRRRAWASRIILEMSQNANNTFLTLTYDDDHQPLNGSLEPKHLQDCFKRVRKAGLKFRYFACGEYGEKSFRPHYHAILFGVHHDVAHAFFSEKWKFGFIYALPALIESAEYVAGYVSKKLCNDSRDYEDCGLRKEFIRVSKFPAVGAFALEQLKKVAFAQSDLDVLREIRIGQKKYPLPKYMKRKLREFFFDDSYRNELSEAFVLNMRDELEALVQKHFGDKADFFLRAREAYLLENRQNFINLDTKEKIYNSRNKI